MYKDSALIKAASESSDPRVMNKLTYNVIAYVTDILECGK